MKKFKKYNFDALEQLIQENKETVKSITVGMAEDFSATCEEVYSLENGIDTDITKTGVVAGISGSNWATPIARIEYTNGNTIEVDFYIECETIPEEI